MEVNWQLAAAATGIGTVAVCVYRMRVKAGALAERDAAAPEKVAFKQLYPAPIMILRFPFHLIVRKLLAKFYCTLRLTDDEIAALPEPNGRATLEMRTLVGRKPHAFALPCCMYGTLQALKWRPRPSDIIVLTAPKTGTSWLQHMLHLIKTGGDDVAFDDVYEVAPWIDFAWEMGQDLDADQRGGTRVFKSHGIISRVHEGCKYVVTIRNPVAMLKSLYLFAASKDEAAPFIGSLFLSDINVFYKCPLWQDGLDMSGGESFFRSYVEFYKCRHCPTVCLLIFEQMQKDLRGTITKMCDFMGVAPTPSLIDKVAEKSSLQWMTAHASKFDDHMIYDKQVELGRYSFMLNPPASKVLLKPTTADARSKAEPNAKTLQALRADWKRYVTPETGFETYEDMVEALQKERAAGH